MIKTEIGDIAGYIWKYLDKEGETEYSALKKAIKEKHDVEEQFFVMAIGWLLRENNIQVINDGKKIDTSKVKIQ
ncbi:MAG TPA: winged helix-turn-helix domain-containing protein [Candidatus Wallbacteria bacterium]|nr:winged helix-turn-helix domain-containing protein [Candidatus Wallbacteria bacterium]